MTNKIDQKNTDNILYIMICEARNLEEGMLRGKSVKVFYGCPTHAQLAGFLKKHKDLPFEISSTGEVIPRFTKWEIIHHLKKKYLEHRRKYICSGPIDPKGVL